VYFAKNVQISKSKNIKKWKILQGVDHIEITVQDHILDNSVDIGKQRTSRYTGQAGEPHVSNLEKEKNHEHRNSKRNSR